MRLVGVDNIEKRLYSSSYLRWCVLQALDSIWEISVVDAVPVAIVLRKQSPRSTASCHPEYAFNEAAALGFLTNVEIWT